MHLTPAYAWILLPVIALVFTPLFPFVNNDTLILGFPVMMVWVAGWGVATTLILAALYRNEPELGEPSDDAAAAENAHSQEVASLSSQPSSVPSSSHSSLPLGRRELLDTRTGWSIGNRGTSRLTTFFLQVGAVSTPARHIRAHRPERNLRDQHTHAPHSRVHRHVPHRPGRVEARQGLQLPHQCRPGRPPVPQSAPRQARRPGFRRLLRPHRPGPDRRSRHHGLLRHR